MCVYQRTSCSRCRVHMPPLPWWCWWARPDWCLLIAEREGSPLQLCEWWLYCQHLWLHTHLWHQPHWLAPSCVCVCVCVCGRMCVGAHVRVCVHVQVHVTHSVVTLNHCLLSTSSGWFESRDTSWSIAFRALNLNVLEYHSSLNTKRWQCLF